MYVSPYIDPERNLYFPLKSRITGDENTLEPSPTSFALPKQLVLGSFVASALKKGFVLVPCS